MQDVPKPQYALLIAALAEIADLLDPNLPAIGVPKQDVKEAREVAVRALLRADMADTLAQWTHHHELGVAHWLTDCTECQPMRDALKHAHGED